MLHETGYLDSGDEPLSEKKQEIHQREIWTPSLSKSCGCQWQQVVVAGRNEPVFYGTVWICKMLVCKRWKKVKKYKNCFTKNLRKILFVLRMFWTAVVTHVLRNEQIEKKTAVFQQSRQSVSMLTFCLSCWVVCKIQEQVVSCRVDQLLPSWFNTLYIQYFILCHLYFMLISCFVRAVELFIILRKADSSSYSPQIDISWSATTRGGLEWA